MSGFFVDNKKIMIVCLLPEIVYFFCFVLFDFGKGFEGKRVVW
jgi:hypothetical protein